MAKKYFLCLAMFYLLAVPPAFAKAVCRFDGTLDFQAKKIQSSFNFNDGSSIVIEGLSPDTNNFHVNATLNHVRTPVFDISSIVEGSLEIVFDKNGTGQFLRGAIESKYSLINYKPTHELTGHFEVKNGKLSLTTLAWGGFTCDGNVGLFPPYEIDMAVQLADIDTQDLSAMSTCKEGDSKLTGTVSGRVEFLGFIDQLMLRGKIISNNGLIGDLAYDSVLLNFEGSYPTIHIGESNVTEENGLSFNVEGDMDLSKRCDLAKSFAGLKMSPLVNESNLHREWTIKRKQETSVSATEFKYRLNKKANEATSASKEDADMLGIEHVIKF